MELRFALSAQECELLLEFERHPHVQDLAQALGKDASVVSRNLKALAQKSDVLVKADGHWALTQKGRSVIGWAKEAIYSQRLALGVRRQLRLAAPREFAARILLPGLIHLLKGEDVAVTLVSSDDGVEGPLISGLADLGLDCGRPRDPAIAFKRVVPESFSTVASPRFKEQYKITAQTDLTPLNYLKFTRSQYALDDQKNDVTQRYFGTFSDISTLREACVLGHGWAILPTYAVTRELKEKKLVEIPGPKTPDESYGVWWHRERLGPELKTWVDRTQEWLKLQSHLLKP